MVKLKDVVEQFPKSSYCMRCGRNCSKHPQEYKGKVFGSVCITKIIKENVSTKINEDDIW